MKLTIDIDPKEFPTLVRDVVGRKINAIGRTDGVKVHLTDLRDGKVYPLDEVDFLFITAVQENV